MALAYPHTFLYQAQNGAYALGAFNANTLEQVQAIVKAAQLEQAPVIIQVSYRALDYVGEGNITTGLSYMAAIGKTAAVSVDAPVVLHLDHGTPDAVRIACDRGFTSIMFDGSDLPVEENIRMTRQLCADAHTRGIWFEAELGYVPKPGSARPDELAGELTDPADVAAFVRETGIDALAIAIGSHHGQQVKETHLDLERLDAIRAKTNLPLVLHGSSGVADDSLKAGIAGGLCKINIATQLNQAFTTAIRTHLTDNPTVVDPRPYLGAGRASVVHRVQERLRFLGCAGKAGDR